MLYGSCLRPPMQSEPGLQRIKENSLYRLVRPQASTSENVDAYLHCYFQQCTCTLHTGSMIGISSCKTHPEWLHAFESQ